MKRKFPLLSILVLSACFAYAEEGPVAAITGISQNPDTRLITVSYSLSADAIVTAEFECRVGSAWQSLPSSEAAHVSGDVNSRVSSGSRSFTYRPCGNYASCAAEDFRVSVRAWTMDEPPPYMVIDLMMPNVIDYYAGTNSFPYGVTADLYKTSKLVMRRIPAKGVTWTMGSAKDAHAVAFTNDYWMGIYEVTQKQWVFATNTTNQHIVATTVTIGNYDGDDRSVHPVDRSRWIDIRGDAKGLGWPNAADPRAVDDASFLGKLRAHTNLEFDLPTEAQWEYAARAGRSGLYPDGGDTFKPTMGAISGNSGGQTWPVGSFAPNDWGLYDVVGNVFEWVIDYYLDQPYDYTQTQTDPAGPADGYTHPSWYSGRVYRSFRGGSFAKNDSEAPVPFRKGYPETYNGIDQGFRLYLAIPAAD